MIPVEPMLLHHAEQDFVLDDKWVLELKYDGVRAIVDTRNNPTVVYTRKGVDITFQFPEVQPPAGHIYDGEIVGFNDRGFHKLNYVQRRMGISTRSKVLERMRIYPIKFVAFDILDDLGLNYETRIQPLVQMMADDPSTSLWDISPTWDASEIDKLWNIVEKNNFEGLVAKRLDSTYVPGIRTYNWRKIKHNKPDYRE
jgi:bifunctional non-homologous end joining protein LigD